MSSTGSDEIDSGAEAGTDREVDTETDREIDTETDETVVREGIRLFGSAPTAVELVARPKIPGLATVGIWRVSGAGWSAIVKVIRHAAEVDYAGSTWSSHESPTHPYAWRREADALGSDLLRGLDERLGARAVGWHGSLERPDGSIAIWLEDLGGPDLATALGPGDGEAALARYALAARQWGRVQGHLADSAGLDAPWLSRDYLRAYVSRRESVLDPTATDDRAARAIWAGRHRWLDELDGLEALGVPRTLTHLDFHPENLFELQPARTGGEPRTVVIDWAYAGIGRLGEDIATLAVDALADFHLAPGLAGRLFERLVEAYADGLADVAGPGEAYDRGLVRRAVALGVVARYSWLPLSYRSAEGSGRASVNGRPRAEAAPYWEAAIGLIGALAAELDG